ncbi:putative PAS/PAC sensor protein [Carbonactinospora thermoautotrophica]|uniref:Putative PAS/PAC sensor protein n=1 Tax=Carbonactinospora thermoautotrophica TaxID=1469144 RepID=A0A132MMB6_9ACTN|nr:ATP-binding protein [Carbonactinospora thermoautotrophica]KWW99002.1 putative PAS/PAC sensor protein [Carbonactinospora thermoautotrophica]
MPEAHVRVVERDAVRVAWRVPAIAEAARLARWLVRRKVAEWGGDAEAGYTAGLLASELVTNAVVHAGGDALTLVVARADGGLRVEVHDRGRGEPALRRADGTAEQGRGLLVVDALSTAWGHALTPTGKVVWFELAGCVR